MYRSLTHDELMVYKLSGLTRKVKDVIDSLVLEFSDADSLQKGCALRGYMVQLCEECEIDDDFMDSLPDDAARFADGFDWAWEVLHCKPTVKLAEGARN